jgi:hypothetical protein
LLDLGEFVPGQRASAIVLRNRGRSPLKIDRVSSTCACAAGRPPAVLDPGKDGELRIVLNVASGIGSADLEIHSNDPQSPTRLSLSWHGSAKPDLYPSTDSAVGLSMDSPFERVIRIAYPGGIGTQVPILTSFSCDAPQVTVAQIDNSPIAFRSNFDATPRKTLGYLSLRLRVAPPASPGVLDAVGRLGVKYGEQTFSLKLPIHLIFTQARHAQPGTILFAAQRAADLIGKKRTVDLIGVESAEATSIAQKPDWLDCDVAMGETNARLTVVLKEAPQTTTEPAIIFVQTPTGEKIGINVRTLATEGSGD